MGLPNNSIAYAPRLYVPLPILSSQITSLTTIFQRFAYWTTIPVFVLQVLLLCLAIYALFTKPKYPSHRGGHEDIEKSGHQLRNVSSSRGNVSFDTKNESQISYHDSSRILGHSRH
jgi:hypothetical protein